jgi:secreted trypsin-like serine protease
MKKRLISMGFLLLSALLEGSAGAKDDGGVTPYIVNGRPEFAEPTTAALLQGLDPPTAIVACSATLIGCDTAITAGHCFNVSASTRRTLFFQHAGFYAIETAVRHPVFAAYYDQGIGDFYTVTRQEDIALIKLATPVSGITPSPINTTQTPGAGTPGRVVGFGRDPLTEVSSFQQNLGIKRSGSMTLAACQDPTLSPYDVLCWDPSSVIGDPGTDVSTCNVDSGGPLFVDQAGVKVVAGITKGAIQPTGSCIPPVEAFDTNVYRHHQWIEETVAQLGGVPLSVTNCGSLPQVAATAIAGSCNGLAWGAGEAPRVCGFQAELSSTLLQQQHSFQVPNGTQRLRVNLNGVSRTTNPVDVSLYVRAGAPPTTSVYDCAGVATGNFAACEFTQPVAGTWYVLAVRVTGTVAYQVTATEFGPPAPPLVPALREPGRLLLAGLLLVTSLVGLRRARQV